MPTSYPKCSPTEMMGLLVLLGSHKGDEEIARLADDLDLEIDEILPAIDFSQVLGFLKLADGRATLTDSGRQLLAGSIGARKDLIRDKLLGAKLFKTLVRALESAPERRLTEEELLRLVSFTTAPADEFVQNIINWGRYAGLFRYDPDEHLLLPPKARATRTASARRPPAGGEGGEVPPTTSSTSVAPSLPPPAKLASLAVVAP